MFSQQSLAKTLKILIVAKLMFLITFVSVKYFDLSFGDLKLRAADDGKNDAEVYQEAERQKPTKKSYLDELFELPKLSTENFDKDQLNTYLNQIDRRKQEVEERLSLLNARESRILEIEQVVDDKLKRLDEERRFFLDTIQQEKQTSTERLDQLVELYKKMAPKAAAPVFEKLDKDLVVQLFNKLPQKQVTLILSLMAPDTSVKLTEYYGRLRSGKEYEILKEINTSLQKEFQGCKESL